LVNAIWLINPDRIVLGGGVAQCGDLLFQPIWRTIESRCERTFWAKLQIVPQRSAMMPASSGLPHLRLNPNM
jgi:glucokinase